ncbi:zinc knuckle CX2CX4HX4C containing protein [Tanacetum coccineum]|uniref:Zinc knuckle CX2CX4HX4C containing protein n=1 Tax=Tanacetum coccineum TaxID=301880 RepID=A0ABQ5CB74_9ASTR
MVDLASFLDPSSRCKVIPSLGIRAEELNLLIYRGSTRAIEKKLRKMEFGTRFGMTPEFSGVVSHSREALARTMECREALARTMECPCKEELTRIPVWVKIHDVPLQVFSEDGISLIASQIGKPIMLDSFTSSTCIDSWGRSSFARCLIEVKADEPIKPKVGFEPKPHGNSQKNEASNVSTSANDGPNFVHSSFKEKPGKAVDIPSSSYTRGFAKREDLQFPSSSSNILTLNPYDALDDMKSEEEVEVVSDETVNFLKYVLKNAKSPRQAVRDVHIGSNSHLVYKPVQPKNDMKTDFKQPKPKVPSATKVVNVTTTSNSFDAFGSMGDVENARVVSHFNAVREKEYDNDPSLRALDEYDLYDGYDDAVSDLTEENLHFGCDEDIEFADDGLTGFDEYGEFGT